MHRIQAEQQRKLESWIEQRIRMGYKAAHPDDGWVDREQNTINFVYPQFTSMSLMPGDAVALGKPEAWRPVRLVEYLPTPIGKGKWRFEPFPEHPQPKFWRRLLFGSPSHTWIRTSTPWSYCEVCRTEAILISDY